MNTPPERLEQKVDASLTDVQLLKYARDVVLLYERERLYRGHLESSNSKLKAEIQLREKLESSILASEARYRSLFEDSHDPIFLSSRDGILVDANRAFWEMAGYEQGELIGKSVLDLYADPSERPIFQGMIEEAGSVKDFKIKVRKKDGTIIDCLISAMTRRTPDGSVEGYQGTVRDLTEEKRDQARRESVKRMEAIARMAGGIAHEIINPLSVSCSAAQLLGNEKLDPHFRKECVDKILFGIDRASLIIENLITFARSADEYRVSRFNLAQVLEASIRMILSKALSLHIQVRKKFKSPDSFMVGSEELIQRAFLNLLQNSMDAMPTGGQISVDADRQNKQAIVIVRDTGTGIPTEERERIFDPFFSGGRSMRPGLGLTLASRIVLQHGGTIEVESSVGIGSTFTVCLPLETVGNNGVL